MEPQVRRAHPYMASFIPDVVAHEMFDDMRHRDSEAEQAAFNTSMVSSGFACELFDDVFVGMSHQGIQHPIFNLPHSEVVWDEELHQLHGGMDDTLDCKQAMFTTPIISNGDTEFDVLLS